MSQDYRWYSGQYLPSNPQRTQDQQYQNSTTNNVQSGHRLLAVYPPASATPTHHVSRHISNITLTGAPTFPQPSYHNPNSGFSQENPPPYSEYDQQLHYLASSQAPSNVGYWESARDDAVKMLNEQAGPSYREPTQWLNPMPQSNYQTNAFAQSVFQRTAPSTSYPTPPPGISPSSSSLAHALGTSPSHGHPRPAQSPQKIYHPQESRAFYEDFLDRKTQQMNQYAPPSLPPQNARNSASYSPYSSYPSNPRPDAVDPPSFPSFPPHTVHQFNATQSATYSLGGALVPHSIAPPPSPHVNNYNNNHYLRSPLPGIHAQALHAQALQPPAQTTSFIPSTPQLARQQEPAHLTPSKKRPVEDSPDPLTLKSGGSTTINVTPRKRKLMVEAQTPVKRLHFMKSLSSSSLGAATMTPQSTRSVQITPGSSAASLSDMSMSSMCSTPTAKRVNLAYVEVPKPPYLTPKSTRKLDSDDLGGYCTENDSPIKKMGINDSVRSSARRTGDRDERGPLEKLTSLIEDIFEAEDSLPPEVESSDLNHEFFSPLSIDCSRPLLATAIIRKLIKYIGHVARPAKRLRQATGGIIGTPRSKGRMGDLDVQQLSRLLKILDRSVKAGEDIDPFPHAHVSSLSSSTKSSPKKPSNKKNSKPRKGERRSRSATPKQGDNLAEDEYRAGSLTVATDADIDKLSTQLDAARDSIFAADCCIALLGSDRLPKQLYSEELIMACLNSIKNQLTKILYPFVESFAESGNTTNINSLLQGIVKNTHSVHRHQLSELYQALSAVIPRINDLMGAENVAMSDTIIISAVYIAIGPFFVVDADTDPKAKKDNAVIRTLGKSAMRGLRLDSLSLIRSIFANHESQRSWIIEEILTSLIKLSDTKQKAGQFRLRDGRSIRTVSALLLQLVQTSAHDVRIQAKKIEQVRKNNIALKRQESFNESQGQQMQPEPFLDDTDRDELRLYGTALESATKAAKTIILFLTQRSGKGKVTKNSNEAEYRAIFDNLIEDLLVVLFWPEWPAAGLILSIVSKFMVSSLDDVKSNSQAENNAAKQTALEHLGVIAAKIHVTVLKFQRDTTNDSPKKPLYPLEDIVSNLSLKRLNRFLEAHQDVALHLCKRSSEDQAYDSARELTAATLGQELSSALKQVQGWIEKPEMDEDLNIKEQNKLLAFGQRIKQALRDVWKDPATDVFNIGSQEEVLRIDALAEEIATIQNLRNSFNPILSVILMALDSPAIFVRTKALKALGVIVTSDSTILSAANVRRGIESHLLDSSAAVRDAAVELIGKYIIDSPKVASDYYQKIADRIADTAVSVRRRVIKLLKAFYSVTEDYGCMIDIATRLVLRMLDEDETVKDLASKSIEELWFPPLAAPSALKNRGHTSTSNSHDKTALQTKVCVIMGTAANFKDRQSPLEDVLHKIMAGKEGSERASQHAGYGEICEALIDGLVDASDLPGFTVTNCVRTIYLLASAYPSILSGSNASTLLPYLKNASSAEELTTSDYLLKIFRVAVPHMPKTAAKFGQELQAALQPMIIKPSGGGGIQIMQETVGCMCVVVQYLTHDFVRLINLMKSCNARLQQLLKRPSTQELGQNDVRALVMLIFIVALLAENCNFDNLRNEQQNLAADISSISQGPITEHVYLTLLTLYEKYDNSNLRTRVLQCLGFLFRAQPTLMTMERSAYIMDQIFASPEEEGKGRLLKIIQDFLLSEAEKHSALAKESSTTKPKNCDVNMDELVGNTEGFADSGVSSAVVQRYLDHVLEAALSQNASIQSVAIDVLTFTVKQGLAHPLQSFPVIVALETSSVISISNRASALHAILQGKHASLLNARYVVSARKAFEYQRKIVGGSVQGFRIQPTPVALLHRWYCHVREKRAARQDFLKSLVKFVQENGSTESTQDDVSYARFMAENFATFEYKTLEEVFTVIKYLTNILSTTGMQLLEIVSPSHLLTHLHKQDAPQETMADLNVSNANGQDPQPLPEKLVDTEINYSDTPALMRTSVIIAIVMLLKAHLKALYSLSEDKCNKFVVGKKSAIGDKTATKRNENPISWHRLPFATTALLTTEDAEAQKARFLEIWNEDGLATEPQDEEFL